ncbi:MAG: hypothetical protein K2F97_07410 [Muribaculaceae bacterium]|nr:hypothetical protein [Muribaculaceae bacterium]MDE6486861.1 hypothetical protein [Muribaculaceae bacterium]
MNRFKTILWAVAVAAMALTTSCLNSDNTEQKTTENINSAIAYTIDRLTGQTVSEQSISLEILTNYTALTMGFTLNNFTLPDGKVLPKATFADLPLKMNDTGWMLAEDTNVLPTAEGFAAETMPMFSSVRIGAINHVADLMDQTVVGYERAIRMEISNYVIYITRPSTWSTGTTYATDQSTGTSFKSTKPIYLVNLDTEKHTARITVYNAVFAQAMENLNLEIEFRDIPYSFDANGNIRLVRNEEFDPYHKDTPNPSFPISNLSCTLNIFSGITISFNCEAMGGNYHVAADMPFNYGLKSETTQQ